MEEIKLTKYITPLGALVWAKGAKGKWHRGIIDGIRGEKARIYLVDLNKKRSYSFTDLRFRGPKEKDYGAS